MDEYISREDVLRKFIEGDGHDDDRFTEGYNFAVQEYREEVKKIPITDVQPVVHAKWEISSDGYYPYCSRCFGRPNGELTKYCPDCGARMDLDSVTHDRCSNYMGCDGNCFIDDTPCDCDGNIEKCKGR